MLHSKANNKPIKRSTTQTIFFIILIFSAITVSAHYAHGTSVTLAWDPNSPVENVVGYRLYYGNESRNYGFMVEIVGETLKKISGLKKGQNYYFAVTALNGAGQESDFSDEVAITTCTYNLFKKKRVFNATGGVKKIRVRTQPQCEWSVQSDQSWLRIMEGDEVHAGKGFITYSIDPNPDPEKRIAYLMIGEKRFKVIQKGSTLYE
ncbi:MAG TPA: fibronectin type III domain-containing protein [Syntrophorhabdus sp.]|jgi:hypothetical protein|nr:fibronectin type III domain-containing protein [Syntrophorhabdus sp.]OPX98137.1 MAG: Fibronectin type III domain protein [Syntrophorhabdus sp. PtaB.Bin027]HOD77250.1 fibronectin type III domain-containing protein [Syntrophorhabdus sp.]HQM25615.1 fibronectin type III domain-containing protein [Syntrophorhabdus sp.]